MKYLLFIALFVLAGCQSKADALRLVCDAPLDPEIGGADPSMRMMMTAKKIKAGVSNSEVKTMFDALATMDPNQRAKILKVELDSVGITNCAMRDVWAGD